MKTQAEITATTRSQGKIARPADWRYGQKLKEWDASLPAGAEALLSRVQTLLNDRILVRLIEEKPEGAIILTDAKPLISPDTRKALVLKCGPGKWIPGDWWKIDPAADMLPGTIFEVNEHGWWEWSEGYRSPVAVNPGQIVYIGNWVDLEAGGLALCQEGDVRGYVSA